MLASHFKWLGWFRRWVYGMGCTVGIALLPNATGTQFCPKWGPNFESDGDLMGTFASRNGDPKSVFLKIDRNELIS